MSKKTIELTEFELQQSGVIKIVSYFEKRLEKHRLANDHADCDPLIRGNISEIKLFIKRLNSDN